MSGNATAGRLAKGLKVDPSSVHYMRLLYRDPPLEGVVRSGWHWHSINDRWVFLGKSVQAVMEGPFWDAPAEAKQEGFRPTDLFVLRDPLEEAGRLPEPGVFGFPALAYLRWVPEGTIEAMKRVLPWAGVVTVYKPEEIQKNRRAPVGPQDRVVFPKDAVVALLAMAMGGEDAAARHWRCLDDLDIHPTCAGLRPLPGTVKKEAYARQEIGVQLEAALGIGDWVERARKRPLSLEKGSPAYPAPSTEKQRRVASSIQRRAWRADRGLTG